jgi:tRNA (cmo5U34)-methyltransferase
MTSAAEVFDAHADAYDDRLRRALVPEFDAFYDAAVAALALSLRPPLAVLDLGAGTGLLAQRVLDAHPRASLTLLDGAPGMLARARARLGDRCRYREGDFAEVLPEGPWDAIVSALAIHHLPDAGKRALFASVRAALAPGGVFVNAEQVLAPTPRLEREYVDWHRRAAAARGAGAGEWAAAEERMRHDRCATVEDQLQWLRTAGFDDVDCVYRARRVAVMVAVRPT